MPTKKCGGGQPVSRDLARIIRESSKKQLVGADAPLGDHLQAIEERQTKAVEFYLRACAARLAQGQ